MFTVQINNQNRNLKKARFGVGFFFQLDSNQQILKKLVRSKRLERRNKIRSISASQLNSCKNGRQLKWDYEKQTYPEM